LVGYSLKKGKKEEGLSLFEIDQRLNRLSHVGLINYSYQLARLGDIKKASSIFEKIMEAVPFIKKFIIGVQINPVCIMTKNQFKQFIKC
jgi:hypothetical protein